MSLNPESLPDTQQFLSLLPEDSVIFLAAGFPCPDLTVIGRGNGLLGLAGDRSVLIHCGWAVLCYLSLTPWWHKVIVLFENAGSMKEHMKTYIHELLGIPIKCTKVRHANPIASSST